MVIRRFSLFLTLCDNSIRGNKWISLQSRGKRPEKKEKKKEKIRPTRRWNKHRSTNLKRSRNPDIGISLSVWFILFIVVSLTGIGISLSSLSLSLSFSLSLVSARCRDPVKVPFLRPVSYFSARFDLGSSFSRAKLRLRLRLW